MAQSVSVLLVSLQRQRTWDVKPSLGGPTAVIGHNRLFIDQPNASLARSIYPQLQTFWRLLALMLALFKMRIRQQCESGASALPGISAN